MTTNEVFNVASVSKQGVAQFKTDEEAENFVLANPKATAEVIWRGVVVSIYYGAESR